MEQKKVKRTEDGGVEFNTDDPDKDNGDVDGDQSGSLNKNDHRSFTTEEIESATTLYENLPVAMKVMLAQSVGEKDESNSTAVVAKMICCLRMMESNLSSLEIQKMLRVRPSRRLIHNAVRQLKSISLGDVPASMVKLVVHWCHDDTLLSSSGVDHEGNSDGNGSANDGDKNDNAKLCNPHHQVGVISLSRSNESIHQLRHSSIRHNSKLDFTDVPGISNGNSMGRNRSFVGKERMQKGGRKTMHNCTMNETH